MRSFAFSIFVATCLACDAPPPRPQLVVQLEADTESDALASWVQVRIRDQDDQIVRDQIEPASVLPAEIPIVARGDEASRRVSIEAELFDTLNEPSGEDVAFARVSASARFTDEAVRYVRLRFSRACLESADCVDGQTCYRGVCLGACFEPIANEDASERPPICGRCEACIAGSCSALAESGSCGCPGDVCVAGECQPVSTYTNVASGLRGTCVVRGGRLWCWGSNVYGELGVDGAPDTNPTPVEVPLPSPVAQVTTQGNESGTATAHSCALLEDGTLYCWGNNGSGQLGLGPDASTSVASPMLVPSFTSSPVAEVHAGGGHTCARTSDGELWCWGTNFRGQLGVGTENSSPRPLLVSSPADSTWSDHCTGQLHSCGISDGVVYCWGFNSNAQLGRPPGPDVFVPTPIDVPPGVLFSALACGDFHGCGLSREGEAYCWGANGLGNLGRESSERDAEPAPINGDLRIRTLACGRSHCCGLEIGGAMWCWGRNNEGQLGVGSDVINRFRPTPTAGPTDRWTALALGENHSCAVRDEGFLWCWGANDNGQLGLGDTDRRFIPTVVCLPAQ